MAKTRKERSDKALATWMKWEQAAKNPQVFAICQHVALGREPTEEMWSFIRSHSLNPTLVRRGMTFLRVPYELKPIGDTLIFVKSRPTHLSGMLRDAAARIGREIEDQAPTKKEIRRKKKAETRRKEPTTYNWNGPVAPPLTVVPTTERLTQSEKMEFYRSDEWRKLRFKVILKYGATCQCCGRDRSHGVVIHVDHIKPIHYFPHLRLTFSNLQVLCEDCNIGKGASDQTDWRPTEPRPQADIRLIANNGRSVEQETQ